MFLHPRIAGEREKRTRATVIGAFFVLAGAILAGILLGEAYLNTASPYSAVYLTTGEVYFGKLAYIPRLRLTDAWFLDRVTGANGEVSYLVKPFSQVFWKPVNELILNPDQVIFSARLDARGEVAKRIASPSSLGIERPAGSTFE